MGRPSELNEVVTNLILNAIDAMPAGGMLIIRSHVERGDTVVLTVSDTGTGMPEAVRKRVFDPFFTTKGEAGTGLGLSVSYSIVKRHNGEMRVDSQLGRGTTFTIVLPVAVAPATRAVRWTSTRRAAAAAESFSWTTTPRSCPSSPRCSRRRGTM